MHSKEVRRLAQIPIGLEQDVSDEALLELPLRVCVADTLGPPFRRRADRAVPAAASGELSACEATVRLEVLLARSHDDLVGK